MNIYCCECKNKIEAVLVKGDVIYPHRNDLKKLYFWQCPVCKNYVGTHKNSPTKKPLGNIPNYELRKGRIKIHNILDKIWNTNLERKEIYKKISKKLGYKYHTAQIRNLDEVEMILFILNGIKSEEE